MIVFWNFDLISLLSQGVPYHDKYRFFCVVMWVNLWGWVGLETF